MNRMNVRCCCQPQKILGTLPAVPEGAGGIDIALADGRRLRLTVQTLAEHIELCSDDIPVEFLRQWLKDRHYERAYKAEGVTIEDLRSIPVFQEHRMSE